MRVAVSSAGEPDSYALQLLLKRSKDDGRSVNHFVCCECRGLVEAVQGRDYLHTCEDGHYPAASTAIAADFAARVKVRP